MYYWNEDGGAALLRLAAVLLAAWQVGVADQTGAVSGKAADLSAYDDPVHAQGTIEIPQLCAVDIDEGKVTCTIELDGRGTIPPERDADSDFWIRPPEWGRVYLKPRNGAGVALLSRPTEYGKRGCVSASYSNKEVRIDGLPPGSRLCVRTNLGRYAQIMFLDVVRPQSEIVKATFTTWQGKPDGPGLQDRGRE